MIDYIDKDIIWKGKPSQVIYLHKHIFWLFLVILINHYSDFMNNITPFSAYNYVIVITILIMSRVTYFILKVHCTKYTVSKTKIGIQQGILNLKYDETEIFRIKDYHLNKPFLLRIFGYSNLLLKSSDHILPVILFKAIPNGKWLLRKIEERVKEERKINNVYEID